MYAKQIAPNIILYTYIKYYKCIINILDTPNF